MKQYSEMAMNNQIMHAKHMDKPHKQMLGTSKKKKNLHSFPLHKV